MRALVVEYDPALAEDLSQALRDAAFVVEVAADSEAAWFRGDVEDYDLVVLDLGLPKLDGLSVLQRWRASGRSFPVLILSARGNWTEKVDGIEAGADDYLAKPFEMGELIARVRALVRRAAGARPRYSISVVSSSIPAACRCPWMGDRYGCPRSSSVHRLPGASAGPSRPCRRARGAPVRSLRRRGYDAIEALVARLRRKLGPKVIETRRGSATCSKAATGELAFAARAAAAGRGWSHLHRTGRLLVRDDASLPASHRAPRADELRRDALQLIANLVLDPTADR